MVRNESCVTIFHHCCSCIVKIQNVKWSFLHHMYLIVHYLCDQFCIRIVCESCQCTCMTVCLSGSHCIPCPKLLLMTQSFIKFCQKLEFISLINQKLVVVFLVMLVTYFEILVLMIFLEENILCMALKHHYLCYMFLSAFMSILLSAYVIVE